MRISCTSRGFIVFLILRDQGAVVVDLPEYYDPPIIINKRRGKEGKGGMRRRGKARQGKGGMGVEAARQDRFCYKCKKVISTSVC